MEKARQEVIEQGGKPGRGKGPRQPAESSKAESGVEQAFRCGWEKVWRPGDFPDMPSAPCRNKREWGQDQDPCCQVSLALSLAPWSPGQALLGAYKT